MKPSLEKKRTQAPRTVAGPCPSSLSPSCPCRGVTHCGVAIKLGICWCQAPYLTPSWAAGALLTLHSLKYRKHLLQNPVTGHICRMTTSLYFVWEMPLSVSRRKDKMVSPQHADLSLCQEFFKTLPGCVCSQTYPKAWMWFYCIALPGSRLLTVGWDSSWKK